MTTGLPLESIVLIRDHVGNCLDPLTLDTMEWGILPVTEEEPVNTINTIQGSCIMPTSERWRCVLTTTEMVTSPGLHILDWRPYQKAWGDEYLSMRLIEDNPPEKALILSEWLGTKIWQVAAIPSIHPTQGMGEPQESRNGGIVNQALLIWVNKALVRRIGPGLHCTQVSVWMSLKERVLVKRERSQLRSPVLPKERRLKGLVENTFQVQQLFRKHGGIRNLMNLLCQVQLKRILDELPWYLSRDQMGSQPSEDHG